MMKNKSEKNRQRRKGRWENLGTVGVSYWKERMRNLLLVLV